MEDFGPRPPLFTSRIGNAVKAGTPSRPGNCKACRSEYGQPCLLCQGVYFSEDIHKLNLPLQEWPRCGKEEQSEILKNHCQSTWMHTNSLSLSVSHVTQCWETPSDRLEHISFPFLELNQASQPSCGALASVDAAAPPSMDS